MTNPQWDSLVENYYEQIFSFCMQYLRSRADAEEATQIAFEKAFKSLKKLRDKTKAKPWLYTVARNVCHDFARKRKREVLSDKTEEKAVPENQELSILISSLVEKLPGRQKEVFILRHWHGFSTADTAALLKIREGSVKSHLKRAVDTLKAAMTDSAGETTKSPESPSLKQKELYNEKTV